MRELIQTLVALGLLCVAASATADMAVKDIWRHPSTGEFYALPVFADSDGRPPVIHVSSDEGQSWTRIPFISSAVSGELAVVAFAVIPGTESDVFLAGTVAGGVYRSVDRGENWTQWNDAPIGIAIFAVASSQGETAWVLADDGTVYVSADDGENWTLVSGIAFTTVTAIVSSGDSAWVGTDDGGIFELGETGSLITNLTSGTSLGGTVNELVRTMDGTLFASAETGDPDGSHLFRIEAMSISEVTRDGESLHVRKLAALDSTLYLLEFNEIVIESEPGEALELLISDDNGTTFTEDRLFVIEANKLFVGPCDGCEPWIFVAHNEGLYMQARVGIGWNILSAVQGEPEPEPEPPAPERTRADLVLRMVSPALNTVAVSRNTSRFQLSVSNTGPDDLENVLVEIEFSYRVDSGTLVISPTLSWGDSATIGGSNCERGTNSYSDPMLLCRVDALASGESASIVITERLPANTIDVSILALASVANNDDGNSNNNWVDFRTVVADDPENVSFGEEGGGGSTGVICLLILLAMGALRRVASYPQHYERDAACPDSHPAAGISGTGPVRSPGQQRIHRGLPAGAGIARAELVGLLRG